MPSGLTYRLALIIRLHDVIHQINLFPMGQTTAQQTKKQFSLVIDQFLNVAERKCNDFLTNLLSQVEPDQYSHLLTVFSEVLMKLAESTVEKYLKQAFNSEKSKLNEASFSQNLSGSIGSNEAVHFQDVSQILEPFIDQSPQPTLKFESFQTAQTIFVKKQREQQHDSKISNTWKYSKRCLFQNENKQNPLAQRQKKALSIELFPDDTFRYSSEFKIQQFNRSLQQINEQFQTKQKECLPIKEIVQNKLTTLKVIHIQYQLKPGYFYRYSISAFELFKVIHDNKLLSQVTVKGVLVEQFQEFISLLRCLKNGYDHKYEEMNGVGWMEHFNPSKSLKISVDTCIKFRIWHNAETISRNNDLIAFRQFFYSLSDITVSINIRNWRSVSQWSSNLQVLLRSIKEIKRIKIRIQGNFQYGNKITEYQAQTIRSKILEQLASFTEIAQLSFSSIQVITLDIFFSYQLLNNYCLSIEQKISTIFKNNTITYLELHGCRNFPLFPNDVTTLQSLHLRNVTFRRSSHLVSSVSKNSLSLRSIICEWIEQEWKIDEATLNRLQTLIIYKCRGIGFGDISSQSPSSLKFLLMSPSSNIGSVDSLQVVFPKLSNLAYLQLSDISFGHQLLCTIPSPHLQQLHIWHNNSITDRDLEVIDAQWPQLNNITLRYCNKLTERVWDVCRFKGLLQIYVGTKMLGENRVRVKQLKAKGVKVKYS